MKSLSEKFNGPNIKLKMAYNDTRMSSQRGYLRTVARMNKGIKAYMAEHPRELPEITVDEWDAMVEFLCIFEISGLHTPIVQTEQAYTGGLGFVFKRRMLKCLRSTDQRVVDLKSITSSPNIPMISKSTDDFTAIGKICLERAKLEAERRYCGNDGEQLTGNDVLANEQGMRAFLRKVNSLQKLLLYCTVHTVLGTPDATLWAKVQVVGHSRFLDNPEQDESEITAPLNLSRFWSRDALKPCSHIFVCGIKFYNKLGGLSVLP